MKKRFRSLLSLMFISILLLQAAGVSALADEPVTGEEVLVYALYLSGEDEQIVRITAENEGELLDGKPFGVRYGEQELTQSIGGGFMLKDLMDKKAELLIQPPEGYYVSLLYISGEGFDEKAPSLIGDFARATASGAATRLM